MITSLVLLFRKISYYISKSNYWNNEKNSGETYVILNYEQLDLLGWISIKTEFCLTHNKDPNVIKHILSRVYNSEQIIKVEAKTESLKFVVCYYTKKCPKCLCNE